MEILLAAVPNDEPKIESKKLKMSEFLNRMSFGETTSKSNLVENDFNRKGKSFDCKNGYFHFINGKRLSAAFD